MTMRSDGFVRALKQFNVSDRVIRRNPVWYPGVRRLFERLDSAGPDERRDWTAAALRRTLRSVAGQPYGRAVGGGERIESWPLIESRDVRDAPQRFMTGPRWVSVRASTGGTTGMPLPLARSLQSIAAEQAALDYILAGERVDAGSARAAVLRGDDVKRADDVQPPFWVQSHGGRRLIFSSNHLSARTVEAYLETLRSFRADYWWAYPSAIEALQRLADEAKASVPVPLVLTSSEVMSMESRRRVSDTFGCRTLDYYGQAERVAFAYSREPGEYYVLPGYAYVELHERGVEDGVHLYEIVGTPLWNQAMSLVRYRTGDLIGSREPLSDEARTEIALGVRSFTAIRGRSGDVLVAPDGTVLTGMDHIQRGVEHIVRIQIVHEDETRVQILVLPDKSFSQDDAHQILQNARRKIPATMQIDVRATEELEKTARGKVPFVIRRGAVR